ncbi:sulfur carrier protein ThiS [Streptomyces sp. SID3915]|uniref:sulfur carrier protein ThiS n=1 Tax=Streptomyces sp. SID3915 TaxID=2690263 RepID=UPI00136AA5B7|nr:sulfur carrier protein ThiS [Streptomyces sp. SID3915]MYX77307.1 sulfur carrier protein ThiS [Streptomyces sp. SID3915]
MTEHAPVAASGAASASPSVPVPVPVSISVNGEHRSVPAGTALDALVASLTSAHSGVAAALNEAVVPRSQWSAAVLAEGDRVEVLTAVQGG